MSREKSPIKVVGYARVSTKEQAGGFSPDAQAEKIRKYCDLHGLDLVGVEVDPGRSGKDLDRPGIRAALARLESGEAGGLVVAKLDRLTRRVRDLDHLLETYFVDGKGYDLLSVADSIDTRTAVGRLILNVVVSVAQWERETIQERVQDGHDEARRYGTKAGQVPYGRRLVPTDLKKGKPLEDDPAEQAVLARILAERAAGASLRRIAEGLTAEGVPTKTGRPAWSASSIQSILARSARNGRLAS